LDKESEEANIEEKEIKLESEEKIEMEKEKELIEEKEEMHHKEEEFVEEKIEKEEELIEEIKQIEYKEEESEKELLYEELYEKVNEEEIEYKDNKTNELEIDSELSKEKEENIKDELEKEGELIEEKELYKEENSDIEITEEKEEEIELKEINNTKEISEEEEAIQEKEEIEEKENKIKEEEKYEEEKINNKEEEKDKETIYEERNITDEELLNEENYENKEETKEFLESLAKLREILEKKGASGVIEFLRNLRNVDLAKSNGIDLDEFITVIQNLIKDSDNSFPVKEIQNIFNVYDINQNGIMEYKKFLDDLLKLREMSKSRKNHIQKIFNHLDFEGKQVLDINGLSSLYKKPAENDPVPDLLESFITFHNIIRGNRNPLVTMNDFVKFYNYINFLIPETKNDKLFMDFTSETWLLDDKSFDERKNLMKVKIEGLGKQKNRDAKNKLIVSHKTPYGTIKDKINYNLNEQNATMKYNVNKLEDLLGHLRNILSQRGYSGIMSIRRRFMIIDENSNKKITYDEFEKLFKIYRFNLS
jgi:chemotaxis protein histidine kinase CheA